MQPAATIIMDIDLDNLSALEYSLIDARIPGITLLENVIAVEKGEFKIVF